MSETGSIRKIVFVVNGHDAALRRWAVEYLCEALRKTGVEACVLDLAASGRESECDKADVVLVYRCFDLRTRRLMRRVRMQGPFVLFFIDDYLFQPNCKYTGGWNFTMETMEEADAMVSSSSVLLSKIPMDKPKILRRSVLDGEAMSVLRQDYRRTDVFSVGWVAGRGRGSGWDGFVAEMLGFLDSGMREGESCVFNCFGQRSLGKYDKVVVKEHMFVGCDNWRGLYSKMKSLDLGVVINPLDEHDEFCWCKSELKFVETAAMGVPLVTSRVPPYLEFMKEGENGFFASDPKEFAEKILLVMRDEALSRRVSECAFRHVSENYEVGANAAKFIRDVEEARDSVRRR